MVMQKLNELRRGTKKTKVSMSNGSGITVSDEQEMLMVRVMAPKDTPYKW